MPTTSDVRTIQRARLTSVGLGTLREADGGGVPGVVARLGAVQSQELHSSAWGVAQRLARPATLAEVQAALADGTILRTHVLRPTWHYVVPGDLAPLMTATAPRVRRAMLSAERPRGFDHSLLARRHAVVAGALAQGPLTRKELGAVLAESEGAPLDTWHVGQVMMHAELDLLVASGPMRGKQATYRLLPEQKVWDEDEARVHLACTYVRGHGPCRAEDVAWWGALTKTAARAAVADAGLTRHELAGLTLWTDGDLPDPAPAGTVRLLSVFDEFFCHDFKGWPSLARDPMPSRWLYMGLVTVDGMIAGGWSRILRAQTVEITVELTEEPTRKVWAAIEAEAARYGEFCGLEPILVRGQVGKGTIG
ncbi:Winged helix DNA-binding domain-containing protein [Promicromonospora umidemergens]|uniref:Winged helix DNA-binding domain-containing protein n=1 Tax=Promicromonospora umidemergens TaxID=629679 RepID=A0ABP8XC98_9MICO|nr:winged helix DNA-binding domain-containing protein [Promicromonospora umidemergens]MCP2283040.1 Winged helix DNA-binding domain-containing protein [Promicromonospora umidemergens]